MMEAKKTNQVHTYCMLQCLMVAVQPLSVAELAELLAFDFDMVKDGIQLFLLQLVLRERLMRQHNLPQSLTASPAPTSSQNAPSPPQSTSVASASALLSSASQGVLTFRAELELVHVV